MTRAGFDKLDEELKILKSVERPAIIRAIYNTGYKGFIGQEFIPARKDKMASLEQAVKICDI